MSIYDGNDIGLTRPRERAGGGQLPAASPRPEAEDERGAARTLPAAGSGERAGGSPPRPRRRLTRDELIARVPLAVFAMPGRGCSREELAAELGATQADLGPALAACYRRKEIDFCEGYVVAPPRVRSAQ